MKGLSPEEWVPYHRQALRALCAFSQNIQNVQPNSAGLEYTSLMSSFLMNNVSCARSLLTLYDSSGVEWFPVTAGYAIARTMFEVDVTAHYISQSPQERSRQYILFEYVLDKQEMDRCAALRKDGSPSWREAMEAEWGAKWAAREQDVNDKCKEVAQIFQGKKMSKWSCKTIRQLAGEVGHKEAYETFYYKLSSFSHVDVRSANRFLRLRPAGICWTQRANPYDVGDVLHDASSFLTCFLKLFGSQFAVWDDNSVDACWEF